MTETKPMGWWQRVRECEGALSARDRRNSNRFVAWMAVWAASFVAAALVLERGLVPQGVASWGVALAPTALGVGALLAYVHFLRRADELVRKVQLEGLAVGFGVGVVFSMGYRLLERAGAPTLDTSDPVLVMLVAWSVGQLVAWKRYR